MENCSSQKFGFKSNASSDMCVFTLKQLVSEYNDEGSPVFCAFVGALKAFNCVNHALMYVFAS